MENDLEGIFGIFWEIVQSLGLRMKLGFGLSIPILIHGVC